MSIFCSISLGGGSWTICGWPSGPMMVVVTGVTDAPSDETIVAPSGFRGVHSFPKALHSCGLIKPCNTSPERHTLDSSVWISVTEKRSSASKYAYFGASCQPLSGIDPMPRHVRSDTANTSSSIAFAAVLPSAVTARA